MNADGSQVKCVTRFPVTIAATGDCLKLPNGKRYVGTHKPDWP
jgi:hypothetical protein